MPSMNAICKIQSGFTTSTAVATAANSKDKTSGVLDTFLCFLLKKASMSAIKLKTNTANPMLSYPKFAINAITIHGIISQSFRMKESLTLAVSVSPIVFICICSCGNAAGCIAPSADDKSPALIPALDKELSRKLFFFYRINRQP